MGAADLQTHLLQDPGHAVPLGRRGRQGQIHNPERRVQAAAGLLGHQLAHPGHPERGSFNGLRHHIQRLALHGLQGVVHHTGAGDAHIDHLFRLAHAVERAGHERIVLYRVAEDHQPGAAGASPIRGALRGFFYRAAQQGHGVHVDARFRGAHIDAGAHQVVLRQRLGDGPDELSVRVRHPFLHQRGEAPHEVHAGALRRPVQRRGERDIVLRLGGGRHQGDGGDGDALVHNGDPELPLDLFAGFHQALRAAGDLLVDLPAGSLRIRIRAGQQGDPHGNGADIQVLLVDHPDGGENI